MTSFDPDHLHRVVEDYTPRPRHRFHALLPARDMIAGLRRKGASYETIAELLTQHSLPTCRSAIARFCHEILEEKPRTKRRGSARRSSPSSPNVDPQPTPFLPPTSPSALSATGQLASPEPTTPRSKGPRIANIRLAEPIKP